MYSCGWLFVMFILPLALCGKRIGFFGISITELWKSNVNTKWTILNVSSFALRLHTYGFFLPQFAGDVGIWYIVSVIFFFESAVFILWSTASFRIVCARENEYFNTQSFAIRLCAFSFLPHTKMFAPYKKRRVKEKPSFSHREFFPPFYFSSLQVGS